MARKQRQRPKQRGVVGRVVHEFKHGELESSSVRKVQNPRQGMAIAFPAYTARRVAEACRIADQVGVATRSDRRPSTERFGPAGFR